MPEKTVPDTDHDRLELDCDYGELTAEPSPGGEVTLKAFEGDIGAVVVGLTVDQAEQLARWLLARPQR